jgi:3-hydroxyisobutyrate dehydrogenase-like beta-hydroxyacid dehydrogenase
MNKNSVGFIGLGPMGFGMASNLAKAGVPLTVFDARLEPVEAIVALGASAATDGPGSLLAGRWRFLM